MTHPTNSNSTDEAPIRKLIDSWPQALNVKDVDALMAHCEPEIMYFDLAPPLRNKGADAYRKDWE